MTGWYGGDIGSRVVLWWGDVEGNSDLLSSKEEGNLTNFQDQETTVPVPYAWSGIQMMLCQLPTCLNDVLVGPQKGRSLLADDGALTWLIENSSSMSDGVGMVGSGIGAGLGARVGIVRTGLGDMGSGLSKAVKFMGRTITWHSGGSKRGGSSTPVNSVQENGGMKPL
ncbi:hypothetical protein Ancab_018188 [Ancistrocladus abbreviatus]